ncbi:MAG: SanA/YdcF family protein [Treponema sp.]
MFDRFKRIIACVKECCAKCAGMLRKKVFRWKILFTGLAAAFVAVGVFSFAVNAGMVLFAKRYIAAANDERIQNADCILVLGARVLGSGRPSHILEDRILTAIELYEDGVSDALLMSGDHGRKNYNEVKAMKNYALRQGVLEERIFMDHAGFSTYDSCYRARDVFCAEKIVIVTQKYHLYRALYIARRLGLNAYGVASDRRRIYGQRQRNIREFFARIKAFWAVTVKVRPKYLGEQIPVRTSQGGMTEGEL